MDAEDQPGTRYLSLGYCLSIVPNLQGLEKMADIRSIFDGLGDGTMGLEEAAIAFVRMGVNVPEPLKIILQKHQPEKNYPR